MFACRGAGIGQFIGSNGWFLQTGNRVYGFGWIMIIIPFGCGSAEYRKADDYLPNQLPQPLMGD